MLIVNADDWGWTRASTDTAVACHERRRISSVSAMVFTDDAERAASMAKEHGVDVGLHINFSERALIDRVPQALRRACERVCGFLNLSKYALILYHPGLRSDFRRLFEAQYKEFLRLYEREPSHFNGHQHMHLATNMLADRILPEGARVRRSFSFTSQEKNCLNRKYRNLVDRKLAKRHRMTDYFFALPHHASRDRLERLAALASQSHVELMVHPQREDEFRFLMGTDFEAAISNAECAGFSVL